MKAPIKYFKILVLPLLLLLILIYFSSLVWFEGFVHSCEPYRKIIQNEEVQNEIFVWIRNSIPKGRIEANSPEVAYSEGPGHFRWNGKIDRSLFPFLTIGLRVDLFVDSFTDEVTAVYFGRSSRAGILFVLDEQSGIMSFGVVPKKEGRQVILRCP